MKSIKSRGGLTHGRGLTESVRLQWVLSTHKCAAVHRSMTTQWFDQHEPFDLTEERLQPLSSGLVAADSDCINCDKVEEVEARIQKQLVNLNTSIKRKDQIKSLNHLYPAIQIDMQKMHFDPSVLFNRLSAILQIEEDIKPFFDSNTHCIV